MSFPHYTWQKEENTSLVINVLSCLSGNNSYTDGLGCTNRRCLYHFSLISFQCKKRSSSRDSLNAVQAGEVVLSEVNLCWRNALLHLKRNPKMPFPTHTGRWWQHHCPNSFFLSLLADEFHWTQFSHQSKLKLMQTQQQGKDWSSPSTASLQRETLDNFVPLFLN